MISSVYVTNDQVKKVFSYLNKENVFRKQITVLFQTS